MGCCCCCNKSNTDSEEEDANEAPPNDRLDVAVIEQEEEVLQPPGEALKWTETEKVFVNIWKANNLTKHGSDDTDYGECPVCFEPLSENKPTVMQDADENRSCRHFVCFECADDLLDSSKTCPLCRQAFEQIAELPSLLTHPDDWFRKIGGEEGQLTKQDVLLVLNAILPLSSSRITMDIQLEWSKWDPEGTDFLSKEHAKTTICPYVQRKINLPRFQKGVIPDISKPENVGLWFDYWDWDNRGRLAKHEIARAMLKTFSQLLQGQRGKLKIKQMSETLLIDFWPVLDLKNTNYIELDEFIAEDGLAQCIMQLLRDTMNKPPDTEDLIEMGFNEKEFQLGPKKNSGKEKKYVIALNSGDWKSSEVKLNHAIGDIKPVNRKNSSVLSRPSIIFDLDEQKDKALVSMLTDEQVDYAPPMNDLLQEDGLPRWWVKRSVNGSVFYQNNFARSTSWHPPTREQIILEYNNGAGKWYRDRFCSHSVAVKMRIGDIGTEENVQKLDIGKANSFEF